ncbi:hypothetical protein VTN96DRAFT_2340 [Rasamsonia emersonii]
MYAYLIDRRLHLLHCDWSRSIPRNRTSHSCCEQPIIARPARLLCHTCPTPPVLAALSANQRVPRRQATAGASPSLPCNHGATTQSSTVLNASSTCALFSRLFVSQNHNAADAPGHPVPPRNLSLFVALLNPPSSLPATTPVLSPPTGRRAHRSNIRCVAMLDATTHVECSRIYLT